MHAVLVSFTLLILAWGAFAFGGNYPWAYRPLIVASATLGAVGLCMRSNGYRNPSGLILALGLLLAAVLVQVVPMSESMASHLSPARDAVLSQLSVAYVVAPTPHPLSIMPSATWIAVAFLVSYGLLMLGVARFLHRKSARWLAAGVSGVGVALAIVGIVQRPFIDGRIYGFWEPMTRGSSFGPFINDNHFAGWMIMALPVVISLAIANMARDAGDPVSLRERLLWVSTPGAARVVIVLFTAALMSVSLLMTLSRSAIASLSIALLIMFWKAATKRAVGAQSAGAVLLLVFALASASVVGIEAIAERFAHANTVTLSGRLPIWQDTLRVVRDFPLTGTGLNTYGVSMLVYQTGGDRFWREAHSDYLQLAAEGGLLLGVPILLSLAAFTLAIRRKFKESAPAGSPYWLRLGASCGLLAIGIQSLAEFSLQMPGNAALCAVLAGLALHGGRQEGTSA